MTPTTTDQAGAVMAETYTFACDRPACIFTSTGWATPEQAAARGEEHFNEHDTGEPMTELTAFEQSVGFERGE
jgi:hypothetical protein